MEQTGSVARDVTNKIAEVSRESSATGDLAASFRTGTHSVAASVHDLQTILIRLIRTSSDDADRRSSERRDVDEPCVILLDDGLRHPARLVDISEGGACIAGDTLARLGAPGCSGILRLDRHPDGEGQFRLLNVDRTGRWHVRFEENGVSVSMANYFRLSLESVPAAAVF